ncbi:MAG: o-succinylbenzoate synthase [Myxococcaceae bacterium]|nr:o-succinylbenzoate synthase [Myxococcaceae bacterium]
MALRVALRRGAGLVTVTVERWGRALKRPMVTSRGVVAERIGFRVRLKATDGTEGRGEAAPLAPFTESLEDCEAALARPMPAWSFNSIDGLERLLAGWSDTPAARHALECAGLEVLARRRGVPVANVLSANANESVAVSALLHATGSAELAAEAAAAVEAGFTTLKIKIGAAPLHVDANRLLAVRRAVGPECKLRVDANGAWSEGEARSALRGFSALALELCEQPVASNAYDAMARLKGAVGCPLGLDEGLLVARASERLEARVADVWVLKPMALGGVLPALRLARQAAAWGVGSYVTTLLDGAFACAAALHLACVIDAGVWAHGLATLSELHGEEREQPKPSRGRMTLPRAMGWGI